jgi:phosphonopyruvate decarboxylase
MPENVSEPATERRPFVAALLAQVPDALVVSGLGSASYDVFAAGHRPGNFYLWGAMGAAVPLGLGLAVAQPDRSVVVITGDGEQLMGIGALATVAAVQPPNLTIVVLDNGYYGETGMQPSHTSLGTDLVAVARGCGIANASLAGSGQIAELAQQILRRTATTYVRVSVGPEETPRTFPPRDGVAVKNAFRAALGLSTF